MLTQVKERPILFKGHMVRAILENRKTQTRRIAKPESVTCPYGTKGDRLWVRETIHGEYEAKLPNTPPKDCKTIDEVGNYWYAADDEPG